MLVLSRKIGERICIDGDISLEVLRCKNGRVKIGIVAPSSKKIVRMEMVENASRPEESAHESLAVGELEMSICH